MSLVVLRSWSDGQPPKVRAIAPPDSDKDELVVPDHNGRFVTSEVSKDTVFGKTPPGKVSVPPVPQPRSFLTTTVSHNSTTYSNHSSPSPSPPIPELRKKSWNNSVGNRNEKCQTLPSDYSNKRIMEPLSLSRESSVNSGGTDSPPSSPVCGSRYKSLGPELAATIPRRQIIRETWIKESHSNFKKKEMSKSTPLLNLSLDQEDPQETLSTNPEQHCPLPTNQKPIRPISYIDTFYGSDGEPKFGDRPASVVQVFKKDSNTSLNLSQSEKNLVKACQSQDRISNFPPVAASRVSLEVKLTNPSNVFKKVITGRSFSSELIRQEPSGLNPRLVTERKDSLPTLPSQTSFIFRSELKIRPVSSSVIDPPVSSSVIDRPVSISVLDPPISSSVLDHPISTSVDEFPVYKAVHSNNYQLIDDELLNPIANIPIDTTNSSTSNVLIGSISTNQQKILPETKREEDENEEVDPELEALRVDSSRATTSTVEIETPLAESLDGDGVVSGKSPLDSDMSTTTTCSSSTSSPQFFFSNNPCQEIIPNQIIRSNGKQQRSTNGSNRNGSAWAQVPVQCVNRHVFLPPQEKSEQERLNNGHNQENNNYKTNQQRKTFCDELLNDVFIQVPQRYRTRAPPTSSPPPQPRDRGNHHDGIIIFDEEEEDEINLMDSEAESIGGGAFEREKSVDYISVFHNVQVGSINGNSKLSSKPPSSELTRIIGLDMGSLTSRQATLDKISNSVQFGPVRRTVTTCDGQKQGPEAIPHAMTSRSKLIYKWKAKQSFPYDPYDDEDCATTLDALFRRHRHLLATPTSSGREVKDKPDKPITTQWNLSIHSGMDKKLVREVALNSGLVKSSDELRLVNESTAAAVTAFQFLQNLILPDLWGKTFLSVNIGSTFIHTSGYELRGKKLHIIESSDSQLCDSPETSFIELVSRLFSREFILKYESSYQPSWIEILTRFDEMKDLYYKCYTDCYLFLPISFYLEYFKYTGMQISECLEDNVEEGVRWDRNGAIRFNKDLMTDWLQPIINFIKTRLKIKTYDSIVLSGGGANEFIAMELSRILPFVHVYTLPDPENAVVEGLVRIDSANVTLKSPFSIGVGVMTPFDESIHPPEKCVTRQGKKWCSDVWDTLIRKGQPLTIGQAVVKRSYVGAQPGQNVLVLPIFKSDLDEPKLVTSPSVEKCCELRFEINKEKTWREVQLVIKCYESELTIVASGNDGDVNEVGIDF